MPLLCERRVRASDRPEWTSAVVSSDNHYIPVIIHIPICQALCTILSGYWLKPSKYSLRPIAENTTCMLQFMVLEDYKITYPAFLNRHAVCMGTNYE